MKDGLDKQVGKTDKKRPKLHALECSPRCISWICNNRTAGLRVLHLTTHDAQFVMHNVGRD